MNETVSNNSYDTKNEVTSDSIFRIASVSKNFAMFSALLVENLGKSMSEDSAFSIDTTVRSVLPEFELPKRDWENGGKDITLAMLASHTAGLPREGYRTNFNMVTGYSKADGKSIGSAWAAATPEGVLEHVRETNLMFAPGQQAAYSNCGIAVLGSAVVAHYNRLTKSSLTWSELAREKIFLPMEMTHSFFGVLPLDLLPYIGVPGGIVPSWADLIVGMGYDPAAGMWSSANDLTKYLHNTWLRPDPQLITVAQRRRVLRPSLALPDGKQLTGPGWEIDIIATFTSRNKTTALEKTYSTYGKAGDAGGWHSWIDTIPNLGYGIIVMAQESGLADYARIFPSSVRDTVHQILIPAFAEALTERLEARFAGSYGNGRDGGAIIDEVKRNGSNATTYAKLEVKEQILYLRELVINGTSALEGLDRLGWVEEEGPRFWSTPEGVALTPAEGEGENGYFGPGAQVWRFMLPGLEVCDWFDFDGYTDQNGWSLSKVVLVETEDGVELHYPPYDIILSRSS
jgi:CubicO group peptidase (beta-lactamase class C family)